MPSLSGGHSATVIVLDDDLSVCRALRMQLETLGFEVLIFPDAESFLASAVPVTLACLLADVYLPTMNGVELCRHLQAKGSPLRTILMSARDDDHTTKMMRRAGAVALLFKPFDQTKLLRALGKALGKRREHQSMP